MGLNQIQPNRRFWDILKGIGICCVVYGHSCAWGHNFVYAYHLPLFFFISGFMYNEKKYGDKPLVNVTNKIKSTWLKYVIIYWVILLLHNKLTSIGMMPEGTDYYSLEELIRALGYAVLGTANELMGGTLWFVPALCMASFFLGFLVYISRLIENKTHSAVCKFAAQAIMVMCAAVIGQYMITVLLPANIQVSLTVMPFLWGGYLIRNYGADLENKQSLIATAVFVSVIYYVSAHHGLDLIMGEVYIGMYGVAFMGIYVCMTLAHYMLRMRRIGNFLEMCGKSSFWIMAFHFPLIKIIDYIWAVHLKDLSLYQTLPHAFDYLFPIYMIVGIGVPLIINSFVVKLKNV